MSADPSVTDVIRDADGCDRCWWCGTHDDYVTYHDQQWGWPVDDDRMLFEKICLEGFQSGLSWLTILRKRENFRKAFGRFDFEKVARFNDATVERLRKDAGIVRHRGKIVSVINNARQAIRLKEKHGSLANFFWQFEPDSDAVVHHRDDVAASTEQSTAMAESLKKAGWTFVGPTTCYAFMQSMGIVNDHLRACHVWEPVDQARRRFVRPTG